MEIDSSTFTATAQALSMAKALDYVDDMNEVLISSYHQAAMDWTSNAMHDRDLHLPLPPKPVPPPKWVVVTSDSGFASGMPGTDPVTEVVPDLPPVTTSPANFAHIGQSIGGAFYRCYPDDTCPANTVADTQNPSPGLTIKAELSGKYQKQVYPFGGWWLKIG